MGKAHQHQAIHQAIVEKLNRDGDYSNGIGTLEAIEMTQLDARGTFDVSCVWLGLNGLCIACLNLKLAR